MVRYVFDIKSNNLDYVLNFNDVEIDIKALYMYMQ